MGALDDAIREHLDLKRKRGEDPGSLAEKEAEAFGPARREPAPAEPPAPDAEPFEPEREPVPTSVIEPAPEPAPPTPEVAPLAPAAGESPAAPQPPEPDEAWEAPAVRRGDTPPQGVPAVAPPEGPDEDVLEETPDFLQDTPEHDRLWFEQKPPRDFDFDT